MKYALAQKTLDVPPIEKLKAAFRGSGVLTEMDAHILARDAFGILAKGLTAENAARLQGRLQAEGIETDVVAETLLPQLPPTKFVRRVQCGADALLLFDPLGRPFPLEWKHIMMIAAGNVCLQDFNRIRTEREITRYDSQGNRRREIEVEYSTKEESNFHFLCEVIVNRAILRYTLEVTKPFLTQFLGTRATPDAATNFGLFVQELLKSAPGAVLNRGAYYLRQSAAPFAYPTKNAFYEEITWLLWKALSSQQAS